MLSKVADRLSSYRLLDRTKNRAHRCTRSPRHDYQVDVFGHKDVGPKRVAQLGPGLLNGFDEPQACLLGTKKGITAIARECQFMSMAGNVVGLPVTGLPGSIHTGQA